MEIVKIKVMRGPNCWSTVQQQLIVARAGSTKTATEELVKKLAGLHLPPELLRPGMSSTELAAYVAVALQRLAGMECAYFNAQAANDIIFPYIVEAAGIYAVRAAVSIINSLNQQQASNWEEDIQQLRLLNRREGLGPTTKAIAAAAIKRGIPVNRLDDDSLLLLGQGRHQRRIRAAMASSTNAIAVELAQDKEGTKKLLGDNYIPVPEGMIISELHELVEAVDQVGFPLVIKPSDGNHGRGITTKIQSQAEAVKAFQVAQQVSQDVIVERYIQGDDYRFLVINYELVAVARRTPAMVTGDGVSTIEQLIGQTNRDPRRGMGHEQVLTSVKLDEDSLAILATQHLTPSSVLAEGRTLYLKSTANLSTGGTAEDITDSVHADNKALAERVARLMDLDICGIDIIANTISEPITQANGAVLEVNAGPGLRMHLSPSKGKPRDVAGPIVEMLYPANKPSRIPLVAVTGTNGKTTTTRLIAHLARQAGYQTGYTTTDGIYLNGRQILAGDCSGPQSARTVLRDRLVEFAVLECARGGILRSGLGFDQCDIGIVTNVSADHLGLDGIETIEQLANVKSVVPKSVAPSGYAILNADDDLVYQIKDSVKTNIALFSYDAENPRIREHVEAGRIAAFVEDGWFIITHNGQKEHVMQVADVPLTFRGTSACMIMNILPAIITAFIHKHSMDQLRNGLQSFTPSPENTPGRMNEFDFGSFRLMIDYAHNEGGYRELKNYAQKVKASSKTGVIAATGDRRDQDIRNLGMLAAEIFDELIIRHDKDGRGRSNEEITALLMEGIQQVKPAMQVTVISDEIQAIDHAITHAQPDAWIFICTDDVAGSLPYISRMHREHVSNHKPSHIAA